MIPNSITDAFADDDFHTPFNDDCTNTTFAHSHVWRPTALLYPLQGPRFVKISMFETLPSPTPLIPTSPIAKGTRCFPHSMGIRATQRVDQPELLPWHSLQRQQWLPHLCQSVQKRPTRDLLSSTIA